MRPGQLARAGYRCAADRRHECPPLDRRRPAGWQSLTHNFACGEQPGGKQSLAATQIKNAGLIGIRPRSNKPRNIGSPPSLRARSSRQAAGATIALAGQFDETLAQGAGQRFMVQKAEERNTWRRFAGILPVRYRADADAELKPPAGAGITAALLTQCGVSGFKAATDGMGCGEVGKPGRIQPVNQSKRSAFLINSTGRFPSNPAGVRSAYARWRNDSQAATPPA